MRVIHQLKIVNGIVFLDEKEIRGVSRYEIRNSAEDGRTAEFRLRLNVILAGIEPVLTK